MSDTGNPSDRPTLRVEPGGQAERAARDAARLAEADAAIAQQGYYTVPRPPAQEMVLAGLSMAFTAVRNARARGEHASIGEALGFTREELRALQDYAYGDGGPTWARSLATKLASLFPAELPAEQSEGPPDGA